MQLPIKYRYFVRPNMVISNEFSYMPGFETYTSYNYLRPGIVSHIRSQHFEIALRLTKDYFHKVKVIDFGCGDGPFLPSLSKYFNVVTGIDTNQKLIEIGSRLVSVMGMNNVQLICSEGLSFAEIRDRLGKTEYRVIYLLETLEHAGDISDPWGTRLEFLRNVSDLLSPGGIIVISVPTMVGLSYLLQRIGLALFGMHREKITIRELLRASFLHDTNGLEEKWVNGHLGFNHKKLEKLINRDFKIIQKKTLPFQMMYILKCSQ